MSTPRNPQPQAGILNRPPEHVLLAAFTIQAGDSATALNIIEELRQIERRELRSDLDTQDASTAKDAPSPETGELGFADGYDRRHLTITTCFAHSAYVKLGTPTELMPADLIPINWAQLGDNPQQPDQGDILLQVCSDDLYVAEHVVHRVEEELAGRLTLVWTQIGAQRYTTREGRTSRSEGRAVNGFIDGTSNLHPNKDPDDRALVFVNPDPAVVNTYPQVPTGTPAGYGGTPGTEFPPDLRPAPTSEPAWTRSGTYMAVRSSLFNLNDWDHRTLSEQEHVVGRFKFSGASLDLADDPSHVNTAPAFEADPANTTVPANSHTRKSNPRRPEDNDRRLFRRGYPLIAATPTGFDRGLIFIAFARTLSTQFEFMFRAWLRNPNFPNVGAGPDRLFDFEQTVVTGGYYFVPALANAHNKASWILPSQ